MNIDKSKIGAPEFRAYEMRKLVRFLGNKVRSQKFTNQFIAYNADMSEMEMLECMKFKPIKHDNYVKFFNSIISIVANHREMPKEKIEFELIEDMKKDPLINPNRVSQIVGWDSLKKTQDKLEVKPVEETPKVKTRDQIIDELVHDMLELVGVTNPSDSNVWIAKNTLRLTLNKIKHPVLAYYKCLSIKDVICSMGSKRNSSNNFNYYLNELNEKITDNIRYYFYPNSLPKLIIEENILNVMLNTYVSFMKMNSGMSKKESLQLLIDNENNNRATHQKQAEVNFRSKLVDGKRQKRYLPENKLIVKHDNFDIESVKPIQKDEFIGELLKTIGPYHKRKDDFKLNIAGATFTINAWVVGVAINNIYNKLGIDNKTAFGTRKGVLINTLNDKVVKFIQRDLYSKSDASLSYRVDIACSCISASLHIEDDLSRGIIMMEIQKEVALLNEDLDNRLNLNQLKDFDTVIKYLYKIENADKLHPILRHPYILSSILKSFIPLVYSILPTRLAEIDAGVKYVSDIGGFKFNPMSSLESYNPIGYKKYSYGLIECLAQQLNNVLDGRNVNYKVIADELRCFVVYQVMNHYDYYGIKPINSNKIKEIENLDFNAVNETEDYIEPLIDNTDEVKSNKDNITNINEEENEEIMRRRELCDYTKEELRRELEERKREALNNTEIVDSDRIRGVTTPYVSLADLYSALKIVENFMKHPTNESIKDEIIDIIKSFK